jgi:hypothetical protein
MIAMFDVRTLSTRSSTGGTRRSTSRRRSAGCRVPRRRRYRSLDGRPNYLCIYELEDVSVVDDPTYLQNYRSGTVTTERMKAKAKTFYRNVYIRIHAATDGIPLPAADE